MTGHGAVPCHHGNFDRPGGAAGARRDTPVIVWLWDASGPARRGRGITDDEAAARRAAEACLRGTEACSARVESARAVLGIESLTSGYERTGHGWEARRRRDGRITWMPLPISPVLAAS
jgi:hypothetical protein